MYIYTTVLDSYAFNLVMSVKVDQSGLRTNSCVGHSSLWGIIYLVAKSTKVYETSLHITRFLYKVLERAELDKSLETEQDLEKSWTLAIVFFQEMQKAA